MIINNEECKLVDWRDDIPNDRYYISKKGNVYNKLGKQIIKTYKNKLYYIFYFSDKQKMIPGDLLVLEAFNPNLNPNMTPCHLDGDEYNINLDNLWWINKEKLTEFRKNHTNINEINGEKVKVIDWVKNIDPKAYYISDKGNVYNWRKEIIEKNKADNFCIVELRKYNGGIITCNVSKLVLQAFKPIENEVYMVPHHINGNINDNDVMNLEWINVDNWIELKSTKYKKTDVDMSEEIKKPINWFDWLPKDKYFISNYGNIYNSSGYNMSYYYNHAGYPTIVLRDYQGKTHQLLISRLVLQAFEPIDNYDEMTVDHIDGNPLNNKLDNLTWMSMKDNVSKRFTINKFKLFNINYGEKEKEVIKLLKEGVSKKEIYLKTGLNRDYIKRIIKKNNINMVNYNDGNHKFTIDTLFELALEFCFDDINNKELANQYDCSRTTISDIRKCDKYKEEMKSIGYTRDKRPYYTNGFEYSINDIDSNSDYTYFY